VATTTQRRTTQHPPLALRAVGSQGGSRVLTADNQGQRDGDWTTTMTAPPTAAASNCSQGGNGEQQGEVRRGTTMMGRDEHRTRMTAIGGEGGYDEETQKRAQETAQQRGASAGDGGSGV
jgi:hypothetical protein